MMLRKKPQLGVLGFALLTSLQTAGAQPDATHEDSLTFPLTLDYVRTLHPSHRIFVAVTPFRVEQPDPLFEGTVAERVATSVTDRRRAQVVSRQFTPLVSYRHPTGCPGVNFLARSQDEYRDCPAQDSVVIAVSTPRPGGARHAMMDRRFTDSTSLSPEDHRAIRLVITHFTKVGFAMQTFDVVLRKSAGEWSVFRVVPLLIID